MWSSQSAAKLICASSHTRTSPLAIEAAYLRDRDTPIGGPEFRVTSTSGDIQVTGTSLPSSITIISLGCCVVVPSNPSMVVLSTDWDSFRAVIRNEILYPISSLRL